MKPDQSRLLGWSEFNTSIDPEYRKHVAKDRKFLGILGDSSEEVESEEVEFTKTKILSRDDSVFIPAGEIRLDGFERFELYSIEVQHLEKDREFLTIHLDSPWREQTLYKKNANYTIPIGKPLPLSGPFRPLLSSDPIFIWFGDLKWRWEVYKFTQIPYNPSKVHPEGVITESVKDTSVIEDSNRIPSRVTIRYEWLNKSVEANFRFQFAFDDKPGRTIEIIWGVISATTAGRSETERVLRCFPIKKKNKPRRRKKRVVNDNRRFRPGDVILLDRGIIAMPMNSELHVSVDLIYCICSSNERMTERMIKGSQSIKVPKNPGVSKLSFSDYHGDLFPTLNLNLEVDWSDEVYPFLLCSGRKRIPVSKSSVESTDDDSFDFFPDPTESEDFELFPDPSEA